MNSTNNKYFGVINAKRRSRIITTFTVLILLIAGMFIQHKLATEIQKVVRQDLEKTLRSNAAAMIQWLDDHEKSVEALASLPEVQQLSQEIIKEAKGKNQQELLKIPASQKLGQRFKNFCQKWAMKTTTLWT